jgi:hypothetical protein
VPGWTLGVIGAWGYAGVVLLVTQKIVGARIFTARAHTTEAHFHAAAIESIVAVGVDQAVDLPFNTAHFDTCDGDGSLFNLIEGVGFVGHQNAQSTLRCVIGSELHTALNGAESGGHTDNYSQCESDSTFHISALRV